MRGELLEELKTKVRYSPDTGEFFWKEFCGGRCRKGLRAGSQINGYWELRFKRHRIYAHRFVFYLMHGYLPKQIDHIDGDKLNNKVCNLRATTNRINSLNKKAHRAGRLPGANLHGGKYWQSAFLYPDGNRKHLGSFKTEKEAHERYMEEVRRYEPIG